MEDFKNHPLVLKDLHPTVSASDHSHFGILGPEMLVSRKFTGSLILPKWKNFGKHLKCQMFDVLIANESLGNEFYPKDSTLSLTPGLVLKLKDPHTGRGRHYGDER